MKERITTVPKRGSILHVPYGEHSQGMINSGLWEVVPEPPKAVEPPHWFLFKEDFNGLHSLGFECRACKSTVFFAPDVNLGAEKLAEWLNLRLRCSHRTTCPADLIKSYIAAGGGQPIPKYELNGAEENKMQGESLSRP